VPRSQAFVDNPLIRPRETRRIPSPFQFFRRQGPRGPEEEIMRISSCALLLVAALGLACCGQTTGTRAVTGGLMGAGAGAGVSALTGGKPATGALIGGGVGAAGGALTR
jgi:hypothetical protein